MTLRVAAALVCDDVRIEDTGKHILIGVYTGGVRLKEAPVQLRMAFWILFEHDAETAEFETEFRLEVPETKPSPVLHASIFPQSQISSAVIFNVPGVPLGEPGELRLMFRETGKRWKAIIKKEIIVDQSTA